MPKARSGRFKSTIDENANIFNSSLSIDKRLYKHDILGSIAHCNMLGKCNIIPQNDADLICKTLKEILSDINNNKIIIENEEDIHMFIESVLTKRIGDVGKKLHTARSRNDQVTLDLRYYLKEVIEDIKTLLKELISILISISEDNLDTIIPAYTHMQKAQPITLAHHFLAYAQMFLRDIDRLTDCNKRVDFMPLGACALAGTSYPTNRELVASNLGFKNVTQNSLDSVSDRDFAIEFLSCGAIIMMHLSRFNEELILWATDEFNYLLLDDKFSTGSSIMPQKKNPDISELIRGKTGRTYGNLISLLTTMKSLPLAYNKDMQEDKEPVFDTIDTLTNCIKLFTAMLPTFTFKKENLLKGASGGYTAATDCADYLAKKGMPFREAYSIIGGLVFYCVDNKKTLDELKLEEFKNVSSLFEKDILDIVKIENVINSRVVIGSPSKVAVLEQIKNLKQSLSKY